MKAERLADEREGIAPWKREARRESQTALPTATDVRTCKTPLALNVIPSDLSRSDTYFKNTLDRGNQGLEGDFWVQIIPRQLLGRTVL
ncbi:hypothetical protein QQ045_006384 [Rhodiola kirilowii]